MSTIVLFPCAVSLAGGALGFCGGLAAGFCGSLTVIYLTFEEPPSMMETPTFFVPRLALLLTPSFILEPPV